MGEKRERFEWVVRDLFGFFWKCGFFLGLVIYFRVLFRRLELVFDIGVL